MKEINQVTNIVVRGFAFALTMVAFVSLPMFTDMETISVYDRGVFVFLAAIAVALLVPPPKGE